MFPGVMLHVPTMHADLLLKKDTGVLCYSLNVHFYQQLGICAAFIYVGMITDMITK